MMNDKMLQERIEHYCLGLMSAEEKKVFELEMSFDAELTKRVRDHFTFIKILEHKVSRDFIKNQLEIIKKEHKFSSQSLLKGLQISVNKYWKTASVAASVAFLASTITFFTVKNSFKNDSHIVKLKLAAIQKEQNRLKKDVNEVKENIKEEDFISKSNGTAFAISNNGLMVTNQHVISGSKNIYIITANNEAHKASIVYSNDTNDIAILKIDEEDFKFSKAGLPYNLKQASSKLSEEIFTLGFPKNEIVYNKGYVSSLNGAEENILHYQMELPSKAGNSGSPIFDNKGNILAIVTAKESNSEGQTYAIKSTVLAEVLKSLPEDIYNESSSNRLSGLSRTQQIETLKEFVCAVKSN